MFEELGFFTKVIDKNCFLDSKHRLSLTEYLSSTSVPLTFLLHFKQVSLKTNTLLKASFTVETLKKGPTYHKNFTSFNLIEYE